MWSERAGMTAGAGAVYQGGSISLATIIERLLDMARQLEDMTVASKQLISDFDPNAIQKVYKQNIVVGKERLEEMKTTLYDFLARGRIEIIDMSDYYMRLAMLLVRVGQKIDAVVYRMLMISSYKDEVKEDTISELGRMLATLEEALYNIEESIRRLERVVGNDHNSFRMLESSLEKVRKAEEAADAEYRRMLATIVSEYSSKPGMLVLFKDLADNVEDAVDIVYDASDLVRILGLAMYSMKVS